VADGVNAAALEVAKLAVDYFDGRSSRSHAALVQIKDKQALITQRPNGLQLARVAVKEVQWPERTRYGARIAQLPGGASVQSRDADAWDAWAASQGLGQSVVVRAQQSWRGVALALVLLVATLGAAYQWGLPVFARGAAALVPTAVDETLGRNALIQIDASLMKPTQLSPETQSRIRQRFAQGVQQTYGADAPGYQLEFRQSTIGPNAFALPGGTMVMTDELVELVKDDEVLMGVLGHELGHVAHRHGMRQLVQVTAMQAALSVAFGDYGSLITLAPLVLGSTAYSRDHEREADAESIRFMRAARISPLVMVKFFEAVRAEQAAKARAKNGPGAESAQDTKRETKSETKTRKNPLGISIISSHPADEERMRLFREAAK
jgi:Zn-dependent protease with chaperone function